MYSKSFDQMFQELLASAGAVLIVVAVLFVGLVVYKLIKSRKKW